MKNIGYKKYRPPVDPLVQESKLQDMVPLPGWAARKKQDALGGALRDELARAANDAQQQQAIKNAYAIKASQIKEEFIDRQVDKSFVEEFHNWILGKSKLNTEENNTPWGAQRLTGKSINAYLHSFVDSKMDFQTKLAKLKLFPPQTIGEAWLYYKYIVCKKEPLDEDYLSDFNYWTNPAYYQEGVNNALFDRAGAAVDPVTNQPYANAVPAGETGIPSQPGMRDPAYVPKNVQTAGHPGTVGVVSTLTSPLMDAGICVADQVVAGNPSALNPPESPTKPSPIPTANANDVSFQSQNFPGEVEEEEEDTPEEIERAADLYMYAAQKLLKDIKKYPNDPNNERKKMAAQSHMAESQRIRKMLPTEQEQENFEEVEEGELPGLVERERTPYVANASASPKGIPETTPEIIKKRKEDEERMAQLVKDKAKMARMDVPGDVVIEEEENENQKKGQAPPVVVPITQPIDTPPPPQAPVSKKNEAEIEEEEVEEEIEPYDWASAAYRVLLYPAEEKDPDVLWEKIRTEVEKATSHPDTSEEERRELRKALERQDYTKIHRMLAKISRETKGLNEIHASTPTKQSKQEEQEEEDKVLPRVSIPVVKPVKSYKKSLNGGVRRVMTGIKEKTPQKIMQDLVVYAERQMDRMENTGPTREILKKEYITAVYDDVIKNISKRFHKIENKFRMFPREKQEELIPFLKFLSSTDKSFSQHIQKKQTKENLANKARLYNEIGRYERAKEEYKKEVYMEGIHTNASALTRKELGLPTHDPEKWDDDQGKLLFGHKYGVDKFGDVDFQRLDLTHITPFVPGNTDKPYGYNPKKGTVEDPDRENAMKAIWNKSEWIIKEIFLLEAKQINDMLGKNSGRALTTEEHNRFANFLIRLQVSNERFKKLSIEEQKNNLPPMKTPPRPAPPTKSTTPKPVPVPTPAPKPKPKHSWAPPTNSSGPKDINFFKRERIVTDLMAAWMEYSSRRRPEDITSEKSYVDHIIGTISQTYRNEPLHVSYLDHMSDQAEALIKKLRAGK